MRQEWIEIAFSKAQSPQRTMITMATLISTCPIYGANFLYHNNHDRTFTEVAQKAGVQ